jgi:Flp pilus assembly pilin Flp
MRKKMAAAARGARAWLGSEKGQNTVEYLLMLTVVVGVVLVAGMALKKFMPGLLSQIQGMISGAADGMGK